MPFKALPGKVTKPAAPARPLPSMDTNWPVSARRMRRLTVPPTRGLPKPAHDTFTAARAHHTAPLVGAVMTRPEEGGDAKVSRGEVLEMEALARDVMRIEYNCVEGPRLVGTVQVKRPLAALQPCVMFISVVMPFMRKMLTVEEVRVPLHTHRSVAGAPRKSTAPLSIGAVRVTELGAT